MFGPFEPIFQCLALNFSRLLVKHPRLLFTITVAQMFIKLYFREKMSHFQSFV